MMPERNHLDIISLESDFKESFGFLSGLVDRLINISRVTGSIKFMNYALCIFPKLEVPEDNILQELLLESNFRESLGFLDGVEDQSFHIGKVTGRLQIIEYACLMLSKIKIPKDNELKEFIISLVYKDIIESRPIYTRKVIDRIILSGGAFLLIPNLKIPEENTLRTLVLSLDRKNEDLLDDIQENSASLHVVFDELIVKKYATYILPKIKISEHNSMKALLLGSPYDDPYTRHTFYYFSCIKHKSIYLGTILDQIEMNHCSVFILKKLKIGGIIELRNWH
eukprot:GHVP01061846.1.p1 GENE.GHVP01061846.1~~GHVP01061846.1.p1  ORF type:complete len:281 (+),score=27.51 GHVP01061846.1:1783-2625(+)